MNLPFNAEAVIHNSADMIDPVPWRLSRPIIAMSRLFTELALGIGAAVLLSAYFVAFSTSWPSSYFSLADVLSRRISVSSFRYALFRFAPVVVLMAFVGVVSSRLGGRPVATALMAGCAHALASAGRGFMSHYQRRGLFARRSLLALSGIVFIGVLASAGIGGFIASMGWMTNLVPGPNELRSDLWTALFAAIMGAAFVKATSGRRVDVPDLVDYARLQVGPELVSYARNRALEVSTDPELVEAILLVESLQRPKWLRGLERRFGRLLGFKTYGIMQVTRDKPLSDRESIDRAVHNYLLGVQIAPGDYEAPRRVFEVYNQNARFVELAETVYNHLKPE